DVHRLAGASAAEQLMRWYQEFSNEHHPASLAHHYVAYRAHVRAKIACLRVAQGDTDQIPLARRYHALARDHAERARLRLIVVGGGPGTGKTTVARAIGERFGLPVLSSDDIRKSVTGTPFDARCVADPGEGIYTADAKQAVYDELGREADALLRAGTSVVVDATWSTDEGREALRAIAGRWGAEVVELECHLDPEIAGERVAERLAAGDDTSDATPEIVTLLASRRDPWPEATPLDTTGPLDATLALASAAVTRLPRSDEADVFV
ncbi:MAG: AAA family ATPase, partial [Actinomycetota bacterium]